MIWLGPTAPLTSGGIDVLLSSMALKLTDGATESIVLVCALPYGALTGMFIEETILP